MSQLGNQASLRPASMNDTTRHWHITRWASYSRTATDPGLPLLRHACRTGCFPSGETRDQYYLRTADSCALFSRSANGREGPHYLSMVMALGGR